MDHMLGFVKNQTNAILHFSHLPFRLYKGSDWQCMVVELRMSYCGELLRDDFKNRFLKTS